ncbi:MAG: phosphoribosylaminoimidazolesuccinocarboxamide synthase, partial [Lysobacterales bacterium CG17_big_fil_post_rev_8_21_14_2_50_64_11]
MRAPTHSCHRRRAGRCGSDAVHVPCRRHSGRPGSVLPAFSRAHPRRGTARRFQVWPGASARKALQRRRAGLHRQSSWRDCSLSNRQGQCPSTRKHAADLHYALCWSLAVIRTLHTAELPGLELLHRGKVRDVFALPGERLLMVASDRLSAFDVVLPDPIPGKGELLCQMSNFWFARSAHLIANHLTGDSVASVLPAGVDVALYAQRSVVVKRLKPLPVEAIARGYLVGSGWKDYQASGRVCGIELPAGLRQAERLAEPIFTPSSKAAIGNHDENIGFDAMVALIGCALAEQVRATTLAIYRFAAAYAQQRGILIADT